MAIVAARLGKKDEALKILGDAIDAYETASVNVAVSPFFDELRSDPRFDELLRKAGLPKIKFPTPALTP